MITQEELITLISKMALNAGVDSNLALSIAYQETGVNAFKTRYEPLWKYLVTPEKYSQALGISVLTETQLQKFSWGPMQVMGSVARELGYRDQLPLLINPQLGIFYACKKLILLLRSYKQENDVISAYNAGSPVKDMTTGKYENQDYVDEVVDRLKQLRGK